MIEIRKDYNNVVEILKLDDIRHTTDSDIAIFQNYRELGCTTKALATQHQRIEELLGVTLSDRPIHGLHTAQIWSWNNERTGNKIRGWMRG
jgi:hypothetical protein